MHQETFGLIEKTKLFLTNEEANDSNHPYYIQENDKTLQYIKEFKTQINRHVKGNLPLSYGFASSTILSLLHLSSISNIELVDYIDSKIHGFKPSGLDSTYCQRNRGGLFGVGRWIDCSYPKQGWDCILLPKESKMSLSEVQKRILKNKNKLLKLAEEMNELLLKNRFPRNKLFDYSIELIKTQIYSQNASSIIEFILSRNVIAKCIGGLYDKAIIINTNNVSSEDIRMIKNQVNKIKYSQYIEGIQF